MSPFDFQWVEGDSTHSTFCKTTKKYLLTTILFY